MRKKTPHIVMLLENNPFPQDERVRKEATVLTTLGYQVSVICPAKKGQAYYEQIADTRIYRYPAPPEINSFIGFVIEYGYALLAAFLLTFYLFLRHGFDILHAHNPPDIYLFVALLYKPLGKKFVFDHHDLTPEVYNARYRDGGNPVVYKLLVWLEQATCRLADHILATNESYKALEMARAGVAANKITVVRNGPDLDRLRPVPPVAALRQRGDIILAYAGAMGVQDGIDYLLRALWHLRFENGRSDFYCIIMGDGDERATLEQLANTLGISSHIRFTGWLSGETYVRHLASADICVDPDPSNPFNDRSTMIKMMEYMAMAKPIVAFDLTEHRYTAQTAALYVPPNDERLFAQALQQLMDDPQRRANMGQNGRLRIEQTLAWKYAAQQLRHAYHTLLTPQQHKEYSHDHH